MTNNHVLRKRNDATSSVIQFDYLTWPGNRLKKTTVFGFEPERFFITDVGLDYTLVAVEPINKQGERLENRGWGCLIEESGKAIFSDLENIIQHPEGKPQQVSLRENSIVGKVDDFLHYEADTQRGSYGSPFYNDWWELGALHHSGVAKKDAQGRVLLVDGKPWDEDPAIEHLIDWIANEGVRISSIVSDLKNRYSTFTSEQKSLFDAAFERLHDFIDMAYYDEVADQVAYEAYYAAIPDDADADEWCRLFRDLVTRTHTTRFKYKSARLDWLYPWIDLRENEGGGRELQGIYSGKVFDPSAMLADEVRAEFRREEALSELIRMESLAAEALEERLEALEVQFPFNCEHVVPQSWFRKPSPMKADLHHLFTCEWGCNVFRGSQPYFDFIDVEEAQRDQCGRREAGQGFEPVCGKGASARATLYFLLRYPGLNGDEARELREEEIELLLAWNEQEPPDRYEYHRNAEIQKIQENRNPMIDFAPMARTIDIFLGFGS